MQENLSIRVAGFQKDRVIVLPIVGESLETIAIKLKFQEGYSICVNGKAILRPDWSKTFITSSQQITFVPDFGDIIGAMYFLLQAATGTIGATSAVTWAAVGSMAIQAGIAIGVGYLIQSLTPKPPKGQEAPSQAYSWNPATTQQQGLSKPRTYGTFLNRGNIIAGFVEPAETGTHSHKLKINALIAYGDGPIKSINDIRINKQPITNFPGTVIETRLGTLNQTSVSFFDELPIQYRPNKLLKHNIDGGTAIFEMPNDDYDDIEVLLGFSVWKFHKDGDATNYSCGYKVEYRAFFEGEWSAWTKVKSETFSHQGTEFFWKKIVLGNYVTIVKGTKYAIRVTKTSGDVVSTRASSELTFDYVSGIIKEKFQYPGTVLIGISGPLTQDFSGLSDVSAIFEGLIVQQLPIVSGLWTLDWSDNPAYIGLDALTQPVISGDGSVEFPYVVEENEGLSLDNIVVDSLTEWVENSNIQCPSGKVSPEELESLVTFNGCYDVATSVWDALLKVCAISRCDPIWLGNKVDFVVDAPRVQVDVLASGNIIEGSFEEAFLPTIERVSEIEVNFKDAQKNYEQTMLPVYSPTLINFQNKATLDFFGITKESEAWRLGRFYLRHNELLKRTLKVKADIDALGYRVGSRIGIQHDVPNWNQLKDMGSQGSGRVLKFISGESFDIVKLDYDIESAMSVSPSLTYELLVRLSNNAFVLKTILSVDGDEVTVDKYTEISPDNPLPQADDLWVAGLQNFVTKDFVLLGLQRSQDQEFSLDFIEYATALWDSDQEDPLTAGIYTTPADSTTNPMKALTLSDVQGYVPSHVVARTTRSALISNIHFGPHIF